MTTHTPGPWDVRRVMGWCAIFAGTTGHRHIVANVGSSNDPEATVEANARLIAVAPSMKRFIEEVARHVYGAIDEEGVRTARALLAQIERETP